MNVGEALSREEEVGEVLGVSEVVNINVGVSEALPVPVTVPVKVSVTEGVEDNDAPIDDVCDVVMVGLELGVNKAIVGVHD